MVSEYGSYKNVPSDAILWDIHESVNDAVVTIDENHGVPMCSHSAEELFGYGCDELPGQDATPLIPHSAQTEAPSSLPFLAGDRLDGAKLPGYLEGLA